MVAQTWGSRRQNKFLDSQEDDFSLAQENGTLSREFWPKLIGDFLAIWPNQQAEEANWEREASEESLNAEEEGGKDKGKVSKSKRRKRAKKARVAPVFASHADWEQDRIKVSFFFVSMGLETEDTPLFRSFERGSTTTPQRIVK
jgi:hypothetical protein